MASEISSVGSSSFLASISQDFIKTADTNSDGKVTTDEFSKLLASMLSSSSISSAVDTSKLATELASKIDTDGNGEISKDELTAFLESNKPKHAHHAPPPDMMIGMLLNALMANSNQNSSATTGTSSSVSSPSTVL